MLGLEMQKWFDGKEEIRKYSHWGWIHVKENTFGVKSFWIYFLPLNESSAVFFLKGNNTFH